MSIENNKQDFEEALAVMEGYIDDLESCVQEEIINSLKDAVSEYNVHLQGDIEELINENSELKDKVARLEDELRETEIENL